ncbi:nidogen-like [Cotesia typhae]|uniref:nidogen-like n=1 Tax=Cotesia typhae TaxID=2053667 RepID=UPI003D692B44
MYTWTIILVLMAVYSVSLVQAGYIGTCGKDEIFQYGKCLKYGTKPGDRCDNSVIECINIPNTLCSSDKTCNCRWGYELKSDVCRPGLGSHCSATIANELCLPANSECGKNNTCVCQDGYFQHMRECVKKVTALDGDCSSDLQCKDLKNSHCFEEKCQCKPGFDNKGGKCTPGLYAPCTDSLDSCVGSNLQCIGGYCYCNGNSFPNGRNCEPFTSVLNGKCSHYRACEKIGHAICFNGVCQCNWNYFKDTAGKCVGGLHAICTSNECQSPNYKCLNKKCVCADNYEESVGNCVPKPVGK